jgi:hypothetical protein
VGQVTYIAMTYRNPELVSALAQRVAELSPAANLVIRHDARHGDLDPATLGSATYRPTTTTLLWGHWSMVEAQLTELRWAREHQSPDWFVFVSGQDYPVGDLVAWEDSLSADLVGEAIPVSYRLRWGLRAGDGDHRAPRAMYRYHRASLPLSLEDQATRVLWRLAQPIRPLMDVRRLPHRSGLYVGRRCRLRGLQLWWGYPWMALSHRAVDRILAAIDLQEPIVDHFRHALIPEEMFIHTLVANDSALVIDSRPITYSKFEGHESHPKALGIGDLAAARSSGLPFARKFEDLATVCLASQEPPNSPPSGSG